MRRKLFSNDLRLKFFITGSLLMLLSLLATAQLTEKDTSTVQFINQRKFFIYKVNKGETLFSISQKFRIPQEEILQFNKDVEKNGLKNKMKIWVPAYSWLKKDSTTEVLVKTEYPESFKISIVTNLQLGKVYTGADTSGELELFSRDLKENLEFVEGILYSTDTHEGKIKLHCYIIDAEGDSMRLITKLKKHKDSNLIITNETGSLLKAVSAFSEANNVKLFSCGVNTFETIRTNGNAFALMPSAGTQCEMAGIFSAKYFNQPNLVAMRTATWKENERTDLFCAGWKSVSDKKIKKSDYSRGGANSIADSLVKSASNLVFFPTSNEEIVSSVLNALKDKSSDYRLNVMGLPTWQYFETVDQKLLDLCNVHLFSSGLIDFNNEKVTAFRKMFRDKYNTEPSDLAYQGYDAFIVAESLLEKSGSKFTPDEDKPVKGLFSDYLFQRPNSVTCFENRIIHVFQPSKDGYSDLAKNFKFD